MNVAIILARGGSKRIPRKNIKSFCGKPIISWPIKILVESKIFDKILVSTDDEEIKQISESFGAEVPYLRDKKLSNDFTPVSEVMSHSVSWMNKQKWELNTVCCTYATSVFLNCIDLDIGYKAILNHDWIYALSVTEFSYPIFRAFKEKPKGGLKMFFPENFNSRSQDLPTALHDAAQFYWGKPEAWLKKMPLFSSNSFPIKVPHWRVQDIDSEDDLKRAEVYFKILNDEKNSYV